MNLFENLQLMKEASDKELLFSFIWEKGSLNDNIINYLKSKNIRFRYGPYLQLFAKINNEWVRFYHENKDGKTYVYVVHSNIDKKDEYIVESILNFEDWLDIYFDDLVKKYADKYEMPKEDVYAEDEDFEEYINDKYEEYYKNTNRWEDDEDLEEDFEISDTNQKYTSAKTSINSSKLPAIFKMINLSAGTINLDYGGGRFDNVAEYYKDKDVINLVYDPYNRSSAHNTKVLNQIKENGGADSVTCSNVLNVIAEPEARLTVIKNIYNLAKSGAPCYFTVYEGSGSGEGAETKSGYQLNKKTADYLEEIQQVFPNAKRKGKLIMATK